MQNIFESPESDKETFIEFENYQGLSHYSINFQNFKETYLYYLMTYLILLTDQLIDCFKLPQRRYIK